jgi:uncharacterized integral membrane protein
MADTKSKHPPEASAGRAEQTRRLVALGALALIVLFAVMNTQEVTINWIVFTTDTPLIVAIAAWTLVGAILGAAVAHSRRKRRA